MAVLTRKTKNIRLLPLGVGPTPPQKKALIFTGRFGENKLILIRYEFFVIFLPLRLQSIFDKYQVCVIHVLKAMHLRIKMCGTSEYCRQIAL